MMRTQAVGVALVLLLLGVAEAARATPAQSPQPSTAKQQSPAVAPKQPAPATAKQQAAPAAASKQAAPPAKSKQATPAVAPFDPLPCQVVRCSTDPEPVCGMGKGAGSCSTPEQGCTYTNVCLAQCSYGVKTGYKGACQAAGSMAVVEAGQQQQQPAKPKQEGTRS